MSLEGCRQPQGIERTMSAFTKTTDLYSLSMANTRKTCARDQGLVLVSQYPVTVNSKHNKLLV